MFIKLCMYSAFGLPSISATAEPGRPEEPPGSLKGTIILVNSAHMLLL